MTTIVAVAPTVEPVTLAEAKVWARVGVTDTSQDALIGLLIQAMREYAENLTGRAFVQRQLTRILTHWEHAIELESPPLISVDSIKYLDVDGAEQTLAADQYIVHTWLEPGIVVPQILTTWPSVYSQDDAIRVNYTAGYPALGSPPDYVANVPAAVKVWMQARLATLYDNRDQMVVGVSVQQIPRDFCDGLLDSLIVGTRFG